MITVYNKELNPLFAESLSLVPEAGDSVLVVRHSTRAPIPPGSKGDEILLTPSGVSLAERLGRILSTRTLDTMYSSTITRCLETAAALCRGAVQRVPIYTRSQLASPAALTDAGERVFDGKSLGDPVALVNELLQLYRDDASLGVPSVVVEIISCAFSSHRCHTASRALSAEGRLRIVISHDDVIAFTLAFLLKWNAITFADLPWMLEGFFLWNEDERISLLWRGKIFQVPDASILEC